jgi:inner membrane protein
MDIITQGVIGAVAAQALARPEHQRRAAIAGGLGGLLPDADVLIRSAADPLLSLEFHRHFTHSLAFVPLGALIAATLAWGLLRCRVSWRALYLPSMIGWATHGLLDASTSYGTRLLWPFLDVRVAWNWISIIDPLFTVPLLCGCILGVRRLARRPPRIALLLAVTYLGLCALQHARALEVLTDTVALRGHVGATRLEAKPSLGNNVLFRCFYELEGEFQVDAVRVPWWGSPRVFAGKRHPALNAQEFSERFHLDAVQRQDIERFRHFSDDFLIEDPRFEGVVSDFRYAALPGSIAPLWGVEVTDLSPGEHVRFTRFSRFDPEMRESFFAQLMGD